MVMGNLEGGVLMDKSGVGAKGVRCCLPFGHECKLLYSLGTDVWLLDWQ